MRLRLRRPLTGWNDQRALVLTDTPRPDCPECHGEGGHAYDYGDHNGEYAGTEWDPCPCWDETRRWTLVRVPIFRRRQRPGRDPWGANGYSDEPPF